MPVRTLILVAMNLVNILCNFYLFQYLEDKRKESIGLYHCISSTTSEFNSLILAVVDRSKERKRKNLIPARLGIYSIYVFGFHTMASEVAYNLLTTKVYEYRPIVKPKFNKITHKYKKWFELRAWTNLVSLFQNGLDCTVRALIVAVSTDSYYCLFCPLLTLFACPAVRRNCTFLPRSCGKSLWHFFIYQNFLDGQEMIQLERDRIKFDHIQNRQRTPS